MFLGKLLGMFGVAVLFVGFWGTLVGNVSALVPAGDGRGSRRTSAPAVGAPAFALLFVAYFTMAYLLLGAVFLGVGAQASTLREIQMLSLPITIVQVAMFGAGRAPPRHAPAAGSRPSAEMFPLQLALRDGGARREPPELWPHVARARLAGFVGRASFITIGARLFRRGVLQSGSARTSRRRGRAVDVTVG